MGDHAKGASYVGYQKAPGGVQHWYSLVLELVWAAAAALRAWHTGSYSCRREGHIASTQQKLLLGEIGVQRSRITRCQPAELILLSASYRDY